MTKISYTKPFLLLGEQLEQLKLRGMKFADEEKALHLLKNIGYYRFSGYWYPLLENKQTPIFKPEATFEAAFNLYKFDRELRKLIIGELEKINSEMQRSDEEFIRAFAAKYSNPLPPSFITLEIASFGVLSKLYENLKSDVAKREISQTFGLADMVFISWLHGLTYIRNVCAHHSRLWNRLLQIQPLFPRRTHHTWLTNRSVCNNHIYYILSIILYFLNTVNPNHSFKQKLEDLFAKYPNVDKAAMGFPAAWHTEPLWNRV